PQSVQASKPPAIPSSSGLSGRLPFQLLLTARDPMPLPPRPASQPTVLPQTHERLLSHAVRDISERFFLLWHAYCRDAREDAID
ncbi:MAG: hypothetical protein ACE5M4_15175, partial [Anaerolineales bacterium]